MELWNLVADTRPLLALGYAELPLYGNLLIALWVWCFGANVGSFMNVVVFRLPAGKSVVSPRSRCPRCDSPIRFFDNIPVLSWLWLRGRCRRCGEPISSRYPTIEALVAATFLVLAFLSPIRLGDNLPQVFATPPALRLQTMESVWLMYGYHLLMICTVLCAALIDYDRQTPPLRLFVPGMVVGVAAPLIWPHLRPVPFTVPIDAADRVAALLDGVVGLSVGAALAVVQGAVQRAGKSSERGGNAWWPEVASAALVGLFLGWQVAAATAVFAAMTHAVTLRLSHLRRWFGRVPWQAHLVFAATAYIVLWRAVYESVPWLGVQASIVTFAVAFLLIAFLSWFKMVLARPAPDVSPQPPQTLGADSMGTPTEDQPTDDMLDLPSYRLAERDLEFLARPELRPIRLQLELLKPEMFLAEQNVESTVVVFGGTQILEQADAEERLAQANAELEAAPNDASCQRRVARAARLHAKAKHYDAAREFGRLVSSQCQVSNHCDFVIITGGGPGIMEAANRGAYDVGAKSIGLNITLPEEQAPNKYITPELCFQFHYFALRKMHFLFRAKALVCFPGGFGTLDELFGALTLRQTNRMQAIPIILYDREYWDQVVDFQFLADEGTIRDEHLELIEYAESPQEAWDIISKFHGIQG